MATAHIAFVIALVFAVSVIKGLRMPSLWAVTHMTFNYSQGFLRRALFGQVLRLFGETRIYHYNFLAACALVLLVLAAVGLFRLVRALLACDRGDRGVVALVLVLAASPGVVFLAHETGYLDYVGIAALPFYVGWAARTQRRFLPFYVAMAMSVCLALVHESMIIVFAPTMLFALLCRVVSSTGMEAPRTRVLLWVHLGLVAVVALAASFTAGTFGARDPDVTGALQTSIASHTDFSLRGDAFEALNRSLRENFFVVLPRHWSHPDNRNYLITTLVAFFPTLVFLGYYGVRHVARLGLGKRQRYLLTTAFLTATVAPLFLNLIGWDSARWSTIALLASFFCLASLRLVFVATDRDSDGAHRSHRIDDPLTLTLAAVAIVAGLCTSYQGFLFDGFVVQWFPFRAPLESAIDWVKGGFHDIPRM